jgi:hypothetical protein
MAAETTQLEYLTSEFSPSLQQLLDGSSLEKPPDNHDGRRQAACAGDMLQAIVDEPESLLERLAVHVCWLAWPLQNYPPSPPKKMGVNCGSH